jgi:8-oxo-dGTP diphosphatase
MTITVQTTPGVPYTIDWDAWQARDRAVLCFIRRPGGMLLILKKRGLGAGLFNAPGGRIEPGETPVQAAVRETQEEVGVTPGNLHEAGVLRFAFTDGYGIHCHVFTAGSHTGLPVETDEADPFWCDEADIPYGRMWADDRIWLPLLLRGRRFDTQFVFEGELMLWHLLTVDGSIRNADAGHESP